MTTELLQQARELILAQRYDEARAILHTTDHPSAVEWLDRLNEISPPSPSSESSAFSSDELLEVVRDLLLEEQFDEAREMLQDIDHPVARQWLARLDAGSPPPKTAAPPRQIDEQPKTHLQIPQWEAQVQFLANQERFDEARLVLNNVDPRLAAQWQQELDLMAPPGNANINSPQPAKLLLQAQHLILQKRVDEAQFILKHIDQPVAAGWLGRLKDADPAAEIWPDLWLDIYEYSLELPEETSAGSWHCQYCSRPAEQAPACPERKFSHCPVTLNPLKIPDKEKLARLLDATFHQNRISADAVLQSTALDTLQKWRDSLRLQQQGSDQNDARRPVIEQVQTQLNETIARRGGGRETSTGPQTTQTRIRPLRKKIRRLPKRK